MSENNRFLPVSGADMKIRGWKQCDFILITGDAYVDHPSFGAAIIARLLESEGYRIGIIAQPDWSSSDDFARLGKPALGWLITSGNMDSMVNHYTVNKKKRSRDAYSPGGQAGLRPDRAVIVYTSRVRQVCNEVPVILGGIEASLRRLSHYDYWQNKFRQSVLVDSKADYILYGMGESSLTALASSLKNKLDKTSVQKIKGLVYRCREEEVPSTAVKLESYEECRDNPPLWAKSVARQFKNTDPWTAKTLAEKNGAQWVIQNPPAFPLERKELDRIHAFPYTRKPHPVYAGDIPALNEVEFSLNHNRGCIGGCSFCAITFHQGRKVTSRSHDSVIAEARELTTLPGFKGYIHDVGGPTANFRGSVCTRQDKAGFCTDKRCLAPGVCPSLKADHEDYLLLLRKLRKLDKVKKVFIRSGIRFDFVMQDTSGAFIRELTEHHVSGQLHLAPEHVSDRVLRLMGKPGNAPYRRFVKRFKEINSKLGKKQFIIPYYISSHPGSSLKEAIELALYLKEDGFIPDQVQDFYPTPGTLSTCMYYSGIDPLSGQNVYVPKDHEEKKMQRALLHFHKPENHALVRKALVKAGRADLIGNDRKSLVPPGKKKKGSHHKKMKK